MLSEDGCYLVRLKAEMDRAHSRHLISPPRPHGLLPSRWPKSVLGCLDREKGPEEKRRPQEIQSTFFITDQAQHKPFLSRHQSAMMWLLDKHHTLYPLTKGKLLALQKDGFNFFISYWFTAVKIVSYCVKPPWRQKKGREIAEKLQQDIILVPQMFSLHII